MIILPVGEFKAHFSDILKMVGNGEEFVISFGKKRENVAALIPFKNFVGTGLPEKSVTIDDFLPSPGTIAESLKKQVTVPVTMKLKRDTVERYKRITAKKGIKYQTFVSTILDTYAKHL